jgi:hypothetical protein
VKRLPALLLASFLGACAHTPTSSGVETLKPAVEDFHLRVRWRDYASAAQYLAPERREAFEEARREKNDEKDLNITDYELEEVKLGQDGKTAKIRSRINWHRLPSVSEQSEKVYSEYEFREGRWLLVRQRGGPFNDELSRELPAAETTAEPTASPTPDSTTNP